MVASIIYKSCFHWPILGKI